MEPVYRPVIGLALTVFRMMGWQIHVRGSEHIPATGSAVLAANHVGYLDFTFIGYGARERGRLVRFLAKKEVFEHRLSGPLMRGMRHIPVDRFGRATESLPVAVDSLRRGEVIGMFPEATISRSFVPRAGKSGAARIAMEGRAPLIPCAVWGSQRILTKGRPRNLQRGVAISVAFRPPLAPTGHGKSQEHAQHDKAALEGQSPPALPPRRHWPLRLRLGAVLRFRFGLRCLQMLRIGLHCAPPLGAKDELRRRAGLHSADCYDEALYTNEGSRRRPVPRF
jgi:1-acyl-sn-glycerol-3-phosphate acyltransferase